jgi:hypothetical protein
MRFKIGEDDSLEVENLKGDLNRLFDEEERWLNKWENYSYFSIQEKHAISTSKNDVREFDRLIEKKVFGKTERLLLEKKDEPEPLLIFDNLDARFGLSSSHHLAPETYFELRHIGGHTEKNATILLEDVLSTYNKLELVLKYTTPRKALATAIALICRGKYQCPMGMRKYFKIAGGPTKVAEAGEIIGIRLRYDPEERIKSWALKMQRSLGVGEDFVQKMMELCNNDKNRPAISNVYMAGVSYKALIDIGVKKTQQEIADVADVTESMLRKHFYNYCDRNNIFLPDRGIGVISSDLIPIQEEFEKVLGYKPHLVKIKLGSPALRDYKMLVDIVRFLLDAKHFAKNPISEYELEKQLAHKYDFRDVSLYSLLDREISPVRRDSIKSDAEEYCIKDKKKVEKWLKVMDKLIQACKAGS